MPPRKQQQKSHSGPTPDIHDIIDGAGITTRSRTNSKEPKPSSSERSDTSRSGGSPGFSSPADIGSPNWRAPNGSPPTGPMDSSCFLSQPDVSKSYKAYSSSSGTSKSQTMFEFDSRALNFDPLISKENMGNTVAMCEALNKMYSTMVLGQCKFEAYMSFNEARFHDLSEKVDYFAIKAGGLDSDLQSLKSDITNIIHNKADCSQISALRNEIEELKDANLTLPS